MKSAGAMIVDAMKMPAAERIGVAEFEILQYEFKPASMLTCAGWGRPRLCTRLPT